MADEVEQNSMQKYFGHFVLKWTVNMFNLQICKEYWLIESPVFSIRGPYTTRWKLALSAQPEDTFISLFLSRAESDDGPAVVCVDWTVRLRNNKKEEITAKELQSKFGKNVTVNVELPKIENVLARMTGFDSIAIHIRCQMLVVTDNCTYKFPKPSNEILASLTHDLEALQTRNDHDAVLEIAGNVIRIHKAIVSCRNSQLDELIQNKTHVNLDSLNIPYSIMAKLIDYFYTGNLDIVLGNPSLSLYESILKLDIKELKQYYATDRIMLSSSIEAEVTTFEWVIRNFSKVKENILLSPILTSFVSNINWRLRLDPRGTGDGKDIAIYAEIVELDEMNPLDMCLQFAIIGTSREPRNTHRLQKHVEINEYLGFDKFISKDYLENYLLSEGDTLRVVFQSQISKDIQSSSIDGYVVTLMPPPADLHSYKELMLSVRSLYKAPLKHNDIKLVSGHDDIIAHKCMLSARSRGFSAMISSMRESQQELHLSDMHPDVLHIIMNFIYCYGLGNLSVADLLNAYEAAKVYVIPALRQICFHQLEDLFLVDDVYDILSFAHRTNDRDLVEMVLKPMSSNAGQFRDLNWERLSTINETLYNNVRRVYEAGLSMNQ